MAVRIVGVYCGVTAHGMQQSAHTTGEPGIKKQRGLLQPPLSVQKNQFMAFRPSAPAMAAMTVPSTFRILPQVSFEIFMIQNTLRDYIRVIFPE